MTRSELIQAVSLKKSDLSYKEIEEAIKHIFDFMSSSLEQKKRIEIRGFGSFSARFRKPRKARNPKTGAQVQKEGKYTPFFRPGKELRARVNTLTEKFQAKEDHQK